ncbi:hypothetical protein ACO2Q9_14370 [Variovorax sp. VNK109]|jgi:hypothetical protein|uniref:hypothetical protein n=1 Tax=Variovorax sp. VNK109 TaxID=3400919 RepID=UPI003C11CCFC
MGLPASKSSLWRCLVAGAIATLACSAQAAYDQPALTEAPEIALQQRFQTDLRKVEGDASFFTPVAGVAWPCEVSQLQQYQAAGLQMAIPEEREKIRKMSRKILRDSGFDASQAGNSIPAYSNIVIHPVRADCKDGKLDGDVEVLASYETLMETVSTMPFNDKAVKMTSRFVSTESHRSVTRFEAGEYKGPRTSIKRTFNRHSTTYDDAAVAKMLSHAQPPEVKEPNLIFNYPPDAGRGLTGTFTVTTTPKFSAGLLGMSTKFERGVNTSFMENSTDVMRMEMYTGPQLTVVSTTPSRDGKPHGEQVTLSENYLRKNNLRMDQIPGMEQARIVTYKGQEMIEKRMCFIEGEIVKTAVCPKD